MLDQDVQLKLQAFVDGELPEEEALRMAALAARDPDANALVVELKNTRKALAAHDEGCVLPESRDFYWSKIQRAIEQTLPQEPEVEPVSLLAILRRWLVPTAGVALLVVGGFMVAERLQPAAAPAVDVQMAFAEAEALTYRDYEAGMTVIWLSYSGENEFPMGVHPVNVN